MPAPWEKYGGGSSQSGQMPWEKYGGKSPVQGPEELSDDKLGLLMADPADLTRSTLGRMDAAAMQSGAPSQFTKKQIDTGAKEEALGLLSQAAGAGLSRAVMGTRPALTSMMEWRPGASLFKDVPVVESVEPFGKLKTLGEAGKTLLKTAKDYALPAYVLRDAYREAKGLLGNQ